MKNYKIFGKINIIDFIVIVAVIVGICAIGVAKIRQSKEDQSQTLIISYYAEEIQEETVNNVHVGGNLFDDTDKVSLGTITDVKIGDSVSYTTGADGKSVKSSKEGFKSITITGEVAGRKTDLGATVNGEKYGVGHTFMLMAGKSRMQIRVYDIKVKG